MLLVEKRKKKKAVFLFQLENLKKKNTRPYQYQWNYIKSSSTPRRRSEEFCLVSFFFF